jgi:Eco57I restriction-modification methylase
MPGQILNKPLFSQHYLDRRLQECPEWQENISDGFTRLRDLYDAKRSILGDLNEAQTEEELIKPVLTILGFSYIPQIVAKSKGRAERPDYGLFASETDKSVAYPLQDTETAFYPRVLAIAEAKYWERSLSDVSKNDKRDIFKNTNPSFQITNYLTGTGVDWGILTNGREWRLYYRQASSTATEFYPIDLLDLLESEDLDAFKYFWLFFRKEAFLKDVHGKNFLERVRDGSTTYATRVGDELKELVFDRIFPDIAQGFVSFNTDISRDILYGASLSLLYKLLFLLYAEARNLLPVTGDYRDYSLLEKTREVADKIDRSSALSSASTRLYDALLSSFRIVDKGDPSLAVPRYNGGLFDMEDGEINRFLSQHKLSDAVLGPVLDRLARFEGQPIDYSFLGVRQLGSIYEGLLEYRIVIDGDSVHLENDKGERKATGSYYTPDYIVKYIVSHTLKPILEERELRFASLMAEMAKIREKLNDKRLGNDSQRGLQREIAKLEREAIASLLDIKVCDPAMGSGHFLVEAVDYLTDELIQILNRYPEENPVLQMLEETRQSILENLQRQGIILDSHSLEPTQLLQRVVMKRCIYGVDLNAMAVELAKVSLWLHSFTIGAPLSFLDHHLRCGNSLIGTTARDAEASMNQEESGQFTLLTGPFVGLLRAAEIMRGISTLSDATFAEVELSEKLFQDFDEQAKPYKRLLDVFVSRFFGIKGAIDFLQRYGGNISGVNWQKLPKLDREVLEQVSGLYQSKRFFHWDLEFPEVFIDLDSATWKDNAGFDAVIGNPPYDELSESALGRVIDEKEFIDNTKFYKEARAFRVNLYRLFIALALNITKKHGYHGYIVPMSLLGDRFTFELRRKLLKKAYFICIEAFPQKDDPNNRVFREAKLSTCLYVLAKQENIREFPVRTHEGKYILEHSPKYTANQAEIEEFDPDTLSIPTVDQDAWKLALQLSESSQCVMFKMIGSPNPGEIMFNQQFKEFLSDTPIGEIVLRGAHIGRYEFYEKPKQGKPIYLNKTRFLEKRGKNKDVKAYDHLKRRIGYQRGAAIDNYRRIIATIIQENFFCSDTVGYFVDVQYSLETVLAFLNSKVSEWRFGLTSTTNHVNAYEIDVIPIPKITFTTPIDRREQSLERLIELYQNNQPLLTQIQEHIERSETDIVHDLLSYLARRMIEINEEKQAEIKGFLKYLERSIAGSIDTFTNKSKVHNYLGDYQKQENHLAFEELLAILKKNQKKIQQKISDRSLQEILEKAYSDSLSKLLPLKEQLLHTDELIDAIVYKLYGLTEEEIKIIEGKD